MSIAFYTCPLCEATCGLELHIEDQEVRLVRGDRDDVFSHGYLCPKGTAIRALEADPDRLRTPADPRRRRVARSDLGRSLRADRCEPHPHRRRARSRRGRDLHGEPERPQPLRVALQPRAPPGRAHAERVLREHGRPDAEAGFGGPDVRCRSEHPGARRRSHRLPLDARRQPVRVERQLDDRARHPRTVCAPCARAADGSS